MLNTYFIAVFIDKIESKKIPPKNHPKNPIKSRKKIKIKKKNRKKPHNPGGVGFFSEKPGIFPIIKSQYLF